MAPLGRSSIDQSMLPALGYFTACGNDNSPILMMANDDNSVLELSLRDLLGPDLLSLSDEPVDPTPGQLLQAPLSLASEPVGALPTFTPASSTAALQCPAPDLDQLDQAPIPFTSEPVQALPPFSPAVDCELTQTSPQFAVHAPPPFTPAAIVRKCHCKVRLPTLMMQNCVNLCKIEETKIGEGRPNLT